MKKSSSVKKSVIKKSRISSVKKSVNKKSRISSVKKSVIKKSRISSVKKSVNKKSRISSVKKGVIKKGVIKKGVIKKSSKSRVKKSKKSTSYKFSSSSDDLNVPISTGIIEKVRRSFRAKKKSERVRLPLNQEIRSKKKLLSSGYTKIFSKNSKEYITIDYTSTNKNLKPIEYLEFLYPNKIKGFERFKMDGFIGNLLSPKECDFILDNLDTVIGKLFTMLSTRTDDIRYIAIQVAQNVYVHPAWLTVLTYLNNEENKIYFDTLIKPLMDKPYYTYTIIYMVNLLVYLLEFRKDYVTLEYIESIRDRFLECEGHNGKVDDQNKVYDEIWKELRIRSSEFNKEISLGEHVFTLKSLQKPGLGHSAIILIDTFKKEVEFFDPNGSCTQNNRLFSIDNKLNYYFNQRYGSFGYKYLNNKMTCPSYSVQSIQSISYRLIKKNDKFKDTEYLYEDMGYCIIWSLWYVDMRLLNEDLPREELLKIIGDLHFENKELSQIVIQNFWTCFRTFLRNKLYHPDNMNYDEIRRCRKIITYDQLKK